MSLRRRSWRSPSLSPPRSPSTASSSPPPSSSPASSSPAALPPPPSPSTPIFHSLIRHRHRRHLLLLFSPILRLSPNPHYWRPDRRMPQGLEKSMMVSRRCPSPRSRSRNQRRRRDAAEARVGRLAERWEGKCDIYQGRRERDEEGRYPLYSPGSCPYVDDAFSCQENRRPDRDYLKWRWKPRDCDLPR